MGNYSKSQKTCGVCNYWDGPRSIDKAGMIVQVDSSSKGICRRQGGPRQRATTQAGISCSAFELWIAFRKSPEHKITAPDDRGFQGTPVRTNKVSFLDILSEQSSVTDSEGQDIQDSDELAKVRSKQMEFTIKAFKNKREPNPKEIIKLLEESIPIMKKHLGPDNLEVLTNQSILAHRYQETGQIDKAVLNFSEVLVHHKKSLFDAMNLTIEGLTNLGHSYNLQDDIDLSKSTYEEALMFSDYLLDNIEWVMYAWPDFDQYYLMNKTVELLDILSDLSKQLDNSEKAKEYRARSRSLAKQIPKSER